MARVEQNQSRRVVVNRQGIIGHREFVCDWNERTGVAPRIGEPFPGEVNLRCNEIQFVPEGSPQEGRFNNEYTHCRILCDYTTFQRINDAPEYSMEFGGEVIDTLYLGTRRFGIHMRFREDRRVDTESIRRLLVHTDDGSLIPLSQVADVVEEGEDLVAAPYQVDFTGLTAVDYVVQAWCKWAKPDGSVAYGASIADTITVTA